MCCLIACHKRLDLETVKKIWNINDDGGGIGWFEKDKAKYIKGITSPEELFNLIEKTPLPQIVHFRLHSVGGYSGLLTHPFEVTRESKLRLKGEANRLLFHNGHDSDFNKYIAAANLHQKDKSPMSDTRAIAMVVSNNNEKFLQVASGKFILLDATCHKIKLFGDFTELPEFPGIAFSNTIWKYRVKVTHCGVSNPNSNVNAYINAGNKSTESEVNRFENEGGNQKKEVEAVNYYSMTRAQQQAHWDSFFGRTSQAAIDDYWAKVENRKKKSGQMTEDALRLTNGAASEIA